MEASWKGKRERGPFFERQYFAAAMFATSYCELAGAPFHLKRHNDTHSQSSRRLARTVSVWGPIGGSINK